MRALFKYFKGYRTEAVLGPFFKLFEACLELLMPIIMATLVNNAFGVETKIGSFVIPFTTNQCIFLLVLITVLGFSAAVLCQYFAAFASSGFGSKLRQSLFSHITTLSHKELDKLQTSSLVNRITSDVNQLQLAVAMFIRLVFRAPVLAVGAFVMVLLINKDVAIIFGVSVPIVAAIMFFILKYTMPLNRKMQKSLDGISVVTRENLTGARVVRAFSRQEEEIERGTEVAENFYVTSVKVNRLNALLNPLASLFMNFTIAVIVVIGAYAVNNGSITSAEITAFVTYVIWILLALIIIANMSILMTRALASAERLSEILEMKSSLKEGEVSSVQETDSEEMLSFDNVFFRYNETEYVLKDINFKMNKGETLGIIGGTGSGKTTLAALILRFYDQNSGNILFCGKEISSYPINTLRKDASIVLQNSTLISGSLRENIAFGDNNPDDDRIIEALKISEAWEFVKKLPDLLDSPVLAGGKNFSGGQVQRLTIARAVYRKPKLLILDDSASALDFATDAKLRKNLKKLSKETSVIIISQRAGSVRHSDKILVMDKGEIVAMGSHKELVKTSPIYKEICLTQFKEEELI